MVCKCDEIPDNVMVVVMSIFALPGHMGSSLRYEIDRERVSMPKHSFLVRTSTPLAGITWLGQGSICRDYAASGLAVQHRCLSHLTDCIVFPTRGRRPSADLMSGGDLDGDKC